MLNTKNKLTKITMIGLSAVFLSLLLFVFPNVVYAADSAASTALGWVSDKLIIGFGWIIYWIVYTIGWFVVYVIGVLVQVASYNDFINIKTVTTGWDIVRDLCNMFFILIMLVIAFATILRQESYSAKKNLPRLLIYAVLINFSKLIFGLIIDFSQVIMLTFVNGFSGGGAANLTEMLGLRNMMSFVESQSSASTGSLGLSTVAGLILGLFAALIAAVVIVTMLAVLIMRLVMMWIYIILSPFAFLGFAFEPLKKYTSTIWDDFIKNVVTGPVLAFFLWLALATASQSATGLLNSTNTEAVSKMATSTGMVTKFFENSVFQTYLITIGLLVGGLIATQKIGGGAGSIAGKGMNAISKGQALGGKIMKAPLVGAKNLAGFGLDKVSQKVGVDLNVARAYKRVTTQMDENRRSRATAIYGKAADMADKGGFVRSKLALMSTGDLAWQNVSTWNKGRNLKRFVMGGKWANKFSEKAEAAKNERANILTDQERRDLESKRSNQTIDLSNVNYEIENQTARTNNARARGVPEELKKEESKLRELEQKKSTIQQDLQNTSDRLDNSKVSNARAKELDDLIVKNTEASRNYRLMGAETALTSNREELESQEKKKIAGIENSEQLGEILKEALKTGNQGLIAATAKKMTKMGDYNEMMSMMGLGTGRDGMVNLAKKFEKEGGMTEQTSLGLIAEIGGIAKNINHFAAFGAATMDNGKWRASTQDEADAAQLAEMLKMQPQKFARDVNRLGLGEYSGPDQNPSTWKPSRAGIAYLKLNVPIKEDYKKTGMQNALEHLSAQVDYLAQNGVDPELIKTIQERAKGTGANVMDTVRSIKT